MVPTPSPDIYPSSPMYIPVYPRSDHLRLHACVGTQMRAYKVIFPDHVEFFEDFSLQDSSRILPMKSI